jgi:outer membrane protein TolC
MISIYTKGKFAFLTTLSSVALFLVLSSSTAAQVPSTIPTPLPTPVIVPEMTPSATPVPRPASTPFITPGTTVPATTIPGTVYTPPPNGAATTLDPTMPVQRTFATPPKLAPDPSRVGVNLADPLSLTLQDAIDMGLRNNNNIDVTRNNVRINEFNLDAAKGIYDPFFNSQTYYESRTTPVASTIGGAVNGSVTQRSFYNDFGLSGFTPKYGGSYDVIFNQARTSSTNRNATLNPQFPTNMIATYTQPLWRGLRIDQNRRQIMIARKNVELTESQMRQQAMDTILAIEQAYWDLVYSMRNLQVQQETLAQAQAQLESNKRLVEKGALAPIEVVAAEAQISTLEQVIFSNQESITRSENILKTLILPDRTAAEWSRPITPTSPVNPEVPAIGLEVATAEAMRNRPELEEIHTTSEINKIDQRFYKDQTKPQVDLIGSYTAAGLAGTPNPLSSGSANVPPNLIGGYGTSVGNLIAQDYPTYRVGVQIGLPLRNRTAKANYGRSLVEGERIENNLAQQEQVIEAEVRNSLQALRSAEASLVSATAGRVAAEELYNSEQRQFRAGTTTFFVVRQRLVDLALTRARELQAQTDLNKAISAFQRAIGTTLSANNVTVSK